MKLFLRVVVGLMLLTVIATGVMHVRRDALMNLPVPAPSAQAATAEAFYFAYGTNMSSRYLFNARNILPARSEPATVQDHEVRFLGPGVNALEPAFAYLVAAPGKTAYGVLHRVSSGDLEKIRNSERAQYEWGALAVRTVDGSVVQAQTLVRAGGPQGTPSRRYRDLLVEGATEHRLPPEYVEGLRNTPAVYVPVASEVMGDVLLALTMQWSGKCASVLVC